VGAFYLETSQTLEFSVISEREKSRLELFMLVDGDIVYGGSLSAMLSPHKKRFLEKGGHTLEIYALQASARDAFEIGMRDAGGRVGSLPETWFDAGSNAGLADYLKDRATIAATETGFEAVFTAPERLRKLRWVFNEYTGTGVQVSELGIVDSGGQVVLPVPHDYTTGLDNDVLEIAPGDRITVQYEDRRTARGLPRTLTSDLSAGFANGSVSLVYEVLAGMGQASTYANALRFRPGDQLSVNVRDPDADVSPEADKVAVVVKTSSGEALQLEALEVREPGPQQNSDEIHSGSFYAILKTTEEGTTGGDTIRALKTDMLKAYYVDEENTTPGVKTTRSSQGIPTASDSVSVATFYRSWSDVVEVPARREGEAPTLKTVYRYEPIAAEDVDAAEAIVIDAAAPVRFEVQNPGLALHSLSTIKARATTASEKARASAEERDPRTIEVVMPIEDGTPDEPNSIFRGELPIVVGEDALLAFALAFESGDGARSLAARVPISSRWRFSTTGGRCSGRGTSGWPPKGSWGCSTRSTTRPGRMSTWAKNSLSRW